MAHCAAGIVEAGHALLGMAPADSGYVDAPIRQELQVCLWVVVATCENQVRYGVPWEVFRTKAGSYLVFWSKLIVQTREREAPYHYK